MKIDTSKIEGYDKMSAEDKLKALEEFELDDNSSELETAKADAKKWKEQFDKKASELAAMKKKDTEQLSEVERLRAEYDEKYADLETKYNEVVKESSTAKLVASYIKQGYKEDLAKKKAEAFLNGDTDEVLACEEAFNKEFEKAIKADVVKGVKKPEGGGDPTKFNSKDEIMKIKDPSERQKAIAENIELFNN